MTTWKKSILASCMILQTTNAFLAPSTLSSSAGSSSLTAMPDSAGNWMQSDSVQSDPFVRESRGGAPYAANGRSFYVEQPQTRPVGVRERQPRPMPNSPMMSVDGPMQESPRRGGLGYGMEARDAFGPTRVAPVGDELIQGGGSRKTWTTSHHDETLVQIGSAGRPIYTTAEVWEGPNNVPARMSLYSEDGGMRPWTASFQNKGRGSSVMDLRNTGPMEFPVDVSVVGKHDGTRGMSKEEKEAATQYRPSPDKVTQTVQGQSLKYFNVKPGVDQVVVELFSEGRPMYAQVELWQGPGTIKQCAEVYSDNGNDRVWSAVIETHQRECTVAIRNVGPAMVYPFKASVDPIVYN